MSRLPAVRDGLLYAAPGEAPVRVGTTEWFAWMSEARSFTFACTEGTFTARHEERSGRRFWYAYRQRHGALRKSYLGRTADLTLPRLQQAARDLAAANSTPSPGERKGDWSSPLIATKLTMPQPGMSLVARPAIVARCLDGIERPCTILAAPAGFGKTTLLIMTCEQLKKNGWQVAWVSLEESERDPVRFWTYALAALDSVQPGAGNKARRMLETPRTPPIEDVLTALINELAAAATTPVALVLDDYHRAATPASDAGLAFLIEHAPTTLHLIVATRADPAFSLAGLRAHGRVAELHAADLRFSPDEAGRFLRETMHVSLPEDTVSQLSARTEGWVAGLQLAALSLREQTSAPDLRTGVSPAPRYVAEYLIDEVVEHQPKEVREFLLQTAVLERLTGPLCDAVTERTDSTAMLARLMRAQLFVTPLDPGYIWYRYHHLFAEVLRERLERNAPETLEQCHRRAAEWLRQQGMMSEAIRHLVAARAFEEAATLIEGESDRLILRGEVAGLVGLTRDLPREIVLAHPHLCVLFAAGLFLQGMGPEAVTWLDAIERYVAEMGPRAVEIAGEVSVVRAILLLISGDFAGGAALASEAMKQLRPEDHLLRGLALWLTNVVGVLGDDNLFDTTAAIAEIAEESLHADNILVAFMAVVTIAGIELFQGRLHQAAQSCRKALRLVPREDGQELPLTAMAYCLLGEIEREWNDLESAEKTLRRALAVAANLASPEFINDGFVSLAMIQAAHGCYEEALATFEELRDMIRTQELASWDLNQMELMRVRVLIAQGQFAEAARWAEACQRSRREQSPVAYLVLLREMEDLALARVALAQGHAEAILAPLEEMCAPAIRAGRLRNVLEATMLLARAHWMLGERDAALRELDAALALAAPEGFMRIFLDEGEPMADVLAGYVANRPTSRERTHALKLLAAFGRVVELPAPPASDELLSPRELDVLRLLATGRSNEAIARELVVALSTVKWHVAHIYRKLGVTGRVQAVTRARELHLIL